jgi:proteasome accessory factor B
MSISKTQRWLDLLAFLTQRRLPVSRAQIMEGVAGYREKLDAGTDPESVRRTFERDKQELQALGIPLATQPLPATEADEQTGYLLTSRDFYLPYLKILEAGRPAGDRSRVPLTSGQVELELDDVRRAAEGVALLRDLPDFPMAAEADSAYRKLTFDLGPAWSRPTPAPLVARADPEEVSERTERITRAMEAGKEIRFRYTGAYRNEVTERQVHPYGLLFKRNHWYVVGHDVDRDALRIFRLSRMDELEVNTKKPGTPDFMRPADFTMDPWREAEPWSLPGDDTEALEVTVRFDFPCSLGVARNAMGEPVGTEPGGVELRRFQVRQLDAFLRWLLTLQGDARVVSPPAVADAFRALVREVAALYQAEAS